VKPRGAVAAGHEATARAAEFILQEGGNAFDAAVAALCTACVAEPVLSSLGGGGFLLTHSADGEDTLYDFFVHTPKQRRAAEDRDFRPISADFGSAQQEFHIGLGSVATPGVVKGLFTAHRDLCTLPMARLMAPAIQLAHEGVPVNGFQAYIFRIIHAIFSATPEALNIFASRRGDGLVQEGELLKQPALADTFAALAREGEALFYEGAIAQAIDGLCSNHGGHLSAADLADYQVIKRPPIELPYRNARVLTNPPPSSGGILIAFALKLLEAVPLEDHAFGSAAHLELLAEAMALTNKARLDAHLEDASHPDPGRLLDPEYVAGYREQILGRAQSLRGTTHISVMDAQGNVASLSVSNGEGCGHIVPGAGVMLNNMLGEQDLNPRGFHRWPPDQRMTSMLSPSLAVFPDGRHIAIGSGGSNRLRTAILQVLVNLVDFHMNLEDAVHAPRIHCEADLLNIEGGFAADDLRSLGARFPQHKIWEERNLFFGGTHCVEWDGVTFHGSGDPRRGGVALIVA